MLKLQRNERRSDEFGLRRPVISDKKGICQKEVYLNISIVARIVVQQEVGDELVFSWWSIASTHNPGAANFMQEDDVFFFPFVVV